MIRPHFVLAMLVLAAHGDRLTAGERHGELVVVRAFTDTAAGVLVIHGQNLVGVHPHHRWPVVRLGGASLTVLEAQEQVVRARLPRGLHPGRIDWRSREAVGRASRTL